jgi:DNA-binding NarL/FixJ family response regulator
VEEGDVKHVFIAVVESDGEPSDPARLASELARMVGQANAVAYCVLPEDPAGAAIATAKRRARGARSASELLAGLVNRRGGGDPIFEPVRLSNRGDTEGAEAIAWALAPPTDLPRPRRVPRHRCPAALREVAPGDGCLPGSACAGAGVPTAQAHRTAHGGCGAPFAVEAARSRDRRALADRTTGAAAPGPSPAVDRAIRITIAIDRAVLRQRACLRLGQASDIEVRCGRLDEVAAASPATDRPGSQVVVIDETHFARVGADAVRALGDRQPDVRVLLVCDQVESRSVDDVLRGGIHGILPAAGTAAAWRRAARAVCRGELWLPRSMLARMVTRPEGGRAGAAGTGADAGSLAVPEGPLTQREAAVVAELRQGFSNKQIANRLGICEDTVKKHLQNVFSKLGVRRRTELLSWPSARR